MTSSASLVNQVKQYMWVRLSHDRDCTDLLNLIGCLKSRHSSATTEQYKAVGLFSPPTPPALLGQEEEDEGEMNK